MSLSSGQSNTLLKDISKRLWVVGKICSSLRASEGHNGLFSTIEIQYALALALVVWLSISLTSHYEKCYPDYANVYKTSGHKMCQHDGSIRHFFNN